MNMKYFCGIAAVVTAMLCAVGCGDDSSSEIYGLNKMNVAGKSQSPAAAVGGYRAGTKREVLVTAGTGGSDSVDDPNAVNAEDYNGPGVADRGGSEWFKAHTLFRMEMNDDDSWYKMTDVDGSGEYTYTSRITMFDVITNTGLRDEQKMPDTLLTKSPAGDGSNVGSGGNNSKNTTGTAATTKTSVTKTDKAGG